MGHPQVRLVGSLTGQKRPASEGRPYKAKAPASEGGRYKGRGAVPEDGGPSGSVQYWTDGILAWRYGPAMKVLKIVPALIVVFVVALLTFKRGMIFIP